MVSPKEFSSAIDRAPSQCHVYVREARPDPYKGLKGHDYIKARNLNPPVQRVQTSAHKQPSKLERCK